MFPGSTVKLYSRERPPAGSQEFCKNLPVGDDFERRKEGVMNSSLAPVGGQHPIECVRFWNVIMGLEWRIEQSIGTTYASKLELRKRPASLMQWIVVESCHCGRPGNISGESTDSVTIEDSRLKGFWNVADVFDLDDSSQVTLVVKYYLVAEEDTTLIECFHGTTTKNSSNQGVKFSKANCEPKRRVGGVTQALCENSENHVWTLLDTC